MRLGEEWGELRRGQVLRVLIRGVPWVLMVIVAAAMTERIAPLRMLDLYLANNPTLTGGLGLVTLNLAAVGFLLLLAVHFLMSVGQRDQASEPVVQLLPLYRRGRKTKSQVLGNAFSDSDSPQIWTETGKTESSRMPPEQRRIFVLRLGGLCLVVGVTGFAFVVGPACVRSVIVVSVVYTVGWLGWALVRDV
jgi:hypothetical protein